MRAFIISMVFWRVLHTCAHSRAPLSVALAQHCQWHHAVLFYLQLLLIEDLVALFNFTATFINTSKCVFFFSLNLSYRLAVSLYLSHSLRFISCSFSVKCTHTHRGRHAQSVFWGSFMCNNKSIRMLIWIV